MTAVVRTECAECFAPVRVNVDTGVVKATKPSNGKRGKTYVGAHPVESQGYLDSDETLLLWDCPVCGYADSTYTDPATRKALS